MMRGLRRVVDALQRSLFDEEPLSATPTEPAPRVVARPEPLPPLAPLVPLVPIAFPRATADGRRRSVLDGRAVEWTLRRARRKTIGFVIGEQGLVIAAPRWVTLREIEQGLQEKARWIVTRLDEQQARASRLEAARIVWADGVRVPYLGAPMTVTLDPGARRGSAAALYVPGVAGVGVVGEAGEREAGGELRLALPLDAAPERIRDATQAWLQRRARTIFEERRLHFEPLLGVRAQSVALSSAATRWGSASSSGAIRLHWRLVHFTLPTIDYVVAHELAHLKEMNHGERFWRAVGSVVEDVEAARRQLKMTELPAWT